MNRKYSIKSIIAAGLLSALICTVVQSCRDEANSTVKATESARFELIDSYNYNSGKFGIYVDNDTGVQYLAYRVVGCGAGVIVMVDGEGKPLKKGENE